MFLKSLILEVSNKQKKIELELNNKTWKNELAITINRAK